jgi:hypothetical protein
MQVSKLLTRYQIAEGKPATQHKTQWKEKMHAKFYSETRKGSIFFEDLDIHGRS